MTAPSPPPTAPAGDAAVALDVVFVQFDRRKYEGALERLLSLLDRLPVRSRVVVVDNAHPGDPARAVTARLVHLGGDNSSWEFSGFDRGLAYLDSLPEPAPVVALATDAFRAYGEHFLSLVTPAALAAARDLRAAVGWVDAWPTETTLLGERYQSWLRTSLLVVPRDALARVRPLAVPLQRERLFSGDPAAPFARDAPLGSELRAALLEWLTGPSGTPRLEESWHSRFTLSRETLPRFEAKTLAILREHLLSRRFAAAGVRAVDLRLVERARAGGVELASLSAAELAPFLGPSWGASESGALFRPSRYHLDRVEVPGRIVHGATARIRVEGWALGAADDLPVALSVGSDHRFAARTYLERPDVRTAFPGYPSEAPGFAFAVDLAGLAPGRHPVVLSVGDDARVSLGELDVAPEFRVDHLRATIPRIWAEGRPPPVSAHALVRSSSPVAAIEALVDGEPAGLEARVTSPVRDAAGVAHQEAVVVGVVDRALPQGDHQLELRMRLASGAVETTVVPFSVAPSQISGTVRRFEIGPVDPDSSLAHLELDVDVYGAESGDHLLVERDGERLLDLPLLAGGGAAVGCQLTRDLPGVAAGSSRFSLVHVRGSERRLLSDEVRLVALARPALHLEELAASPAGPSEPGRHRVRLRGWVENHFLVDSVEVDIGEARAAVFGLHELRPDVARAGGGTSVFRQGFDLAFLVAEVPPGEHAVHVLASQRGGERARVTRRVAFDPPSAERLRFESDDAERIASGRGPCHYSALRVSGTVVTQEPDTALDLVVDGVVADQQRLGEPGAHPIALRAVPAADGEYELALAVSARGRVIHETRPGRVEFRRVPLAAAEIEDLGLVLDHLGVRARLLGGASDAELLARLVEHQRERVPELLARIRGAARRIRGRGPALRRGPPGAAEARRLRVLVAAWESPSRHSGGGTYLLELLRRLGARHDVTLVHTRGADEAGHVDELGPYLARIVTLERSHGESRYRGDRSFPERLYDVYMPELRRALELELLRERYDLVDYQYTAMAPYVVSGLPSVLTVHEAGYTAILNTRFARARDAVLAVPDLDELLRSFHFLTDALPALCPALVTLTDEDAAALAPYTDVPLYTSPVGVARGPAPKARHRDRAAPRLVYVGNFQHPPNIHAVRFLAAEVMPLLRRRYPDAELRIHGTRIPAEVSALHGQGGIRVLGFAPELGRELRRATALVAPLFTGTGMRVKVAEALGAGALVIGTDLALRGIEAVPGRHFLRAHTPAEFVEQIARAFDDPSLALEIAERGQRLAAERHGWDAAVRARESIWWAVVARTATESSGDAADEAEAADAADEADE